MASFTFKIVRQLVVSRQKIHLTLFTLVNISFNPSEVNEGQKSSRALLRELMNWSKKPGSAEFQQRYIKLVELVFFFFKWYFIVN